MELQRSAPDFSDSTRGSAAVAMAMEAVSMGAEEELKRGAKDQAGSWGWPASM